MNIETYTKEDGTRWIKWDGPGMGWMKLENAPKHLWNLQACLTFIHGLASAGNEAARQFLDAQT